MHTHTRHAERPAFCFLFFLTRSARAKQVVSSQKKSGTHTRSIHALGSCLKMSILRTPRSAARSRVPSPDYGPRYIALDLSAHFLRLLSDRSLVCCALGRSLAGALDLASLRSRPLARWRSTRSPHCALGRSLAGALDLASLRLLPFGICTTQDTPTKSSQRAATHVGAADAPVHRAVVAAPAIVDRHHLASSRTKRRRAMCGS